jgi:two-component system, LytTR family, response regulator
VIRTLVVDDEPLARARVRRLFSAAPDVVVVEECADGASALAVLAATSIDLAVLDIEMPARDGFAVADAVAPTSAVIFVTAHEQHARRAFDADAVDYLLKPLDPERVAESLARVRRRIELARATLGRIPARIGRRIRFLDSDAIEWVEAQGNYAALHAAGRVELIRETMTSLERRLDPSRFVRIHRGAIVRIDRIVQLTPQPTGEYDLQLADGVRLLSGRTYRARIAALARGTWPRRQPR